MRIAVALILLLLLILPAGCGKDRIVPPSEITPAASPKFETAKTDFPAAVSTKTASSTPAAVPIPASSALEQYGLINVEQNGIQVDLKYSSADNFMGKDVYGELNKAYLYPSVARKLFEAQRILKQIHPDYCLTIYDAARPLSVQQIMWDLVKGTPNQGYVANPKNISLHNYGVAVDLTIIGADGKALDMGTEFDSFEKASRPDYELQALELGELNKKQLENRKLLRSVMEQAGFTGIANEWWHFVGLSRKQAEKECTVIK